MASAAPTDYASKVRNLNKQLMELIEYAIYLLALLQSSNHPPY